MIGQPAVTVAQTISNYALWVIVAMVVLIFAWSFWSAWRTPREVSAPALSVDAGLPATRRWFVIGAYVLIPITLGALATVVLYATRAPVPAAPPIPTAAPAASDIKINDGTHPDRASPLPRTR